MPAPRPWEPAETDTLRALHADGLSLNAIAKRMARSKDVISRRAADLGLNWDRTRTAVATQAVVLDAKARRAQLANDFLADAERLRKQLWEPTEYVEHGGKDFDEVRWTRDTPIFQDQLRIMQTTALATDRALKLMVFDADDRDLPAVDRWLAYMTGGDARGEVGVRPRPARAPK